MVNGVQIPVASAGGHTKPTLDPSQVENIDVESDISIDDDIIANNQGPGL